VVTLWQAFIFLIKNVRTDADHGLRNRNISYLTIRCLSLMLIMDAVHHQPYMNCKDYNIS